MDCRCTIAGAPRFLTHKSKMAEGQKWAIDVTSKVNELLEVFQLRDEELNKRSVELEKQQAAFQEEMKRHKEDTEKELAAKRLELEEDIIKHEVENKRMDEVYKFQSSRSKLDVGGQIFTTSLQTLRLDGESMLAAMFSGRHELVQESDGSYFIDRDGTHFRHILNFLRDGFNPELLPRDERSLKEIQHEGHYYQLAGLVSSIDSLLNPPPPAPDITQKEIDDMLSTITQHWPTPPGLGGNATFVCQSMTKAPLEFTGKNLSGLSLAHTTFAHNVSFIGATLVNACFYGCEFVSHVVVDFSNADVSGADFRQCRCVQGGPNAFGGPSGGLFGSTSLGSGVMFGTSCSSFAHLIKSGHLKFTGAKHIGTKFDPNIFEVIQF